MSNPAVNSAAPLISLQHVSKSFGGVHAVRDLSLNVYPGELRCLIGPNGAGKSTVFKLIIGTEKPTSGNVVFDGENITQLRPWKRVRKGMSIKMQIPNVYPELSVYDNMRVAAQHHIDRGAVDEEIHRLLETVNLISHVNNAAKHLSHGQQQWLEIGMALSLRPKLLLLDEPTAGMGPAETRATAELIRKLHADGVTLIVIDHDMSFIRLVAEYVFVLHLGSLFAEGSLEEIEQNDHVIQVYLGKE